MRITKKLVKIFSSMLALIFVIAAVALPVSADTLFPDGQHVDKTVVFEPVSEGNDTFWIGTGIKIDQIDGSAFRMQLSSLSVTNDCVRWLVRVDLSVTPYLWVNIGDGSSSGIAIRTCRNDQSWGIEAMQNLCTLRGAETIVGWNKYDLRSIYGPNTEGELVIGISIWMDRQAGVTNELFIDGLYLAGENDTVASLTALSGGNTEDPGTTAPESTTETTPETTPESTPETTPETNGTTDKTDAASKSETSTQPTQAGEDEGGSMLPVILIIVGVIVLAAIAAVVYFLVIKKKKVSQ